MTVIALHLSLAPLRTSCETDARAWVDTAIGCDLGSEFEVPLRKVGKERWRGLFIVDDLHRGPFFYRVALLGEAGAEWSLRLYDQGRGIDLLLDADRLEASKCCFIGTCHVGSRQAAAQLPCQEPTAPAG